MIRLRYDSVLWRNPLYQPKIQHKLTIQKRHQQFYYTMFPTQLRMVCPVQSIGIALPIFKRKTSTRRPLNGCFFDLYWIKHTVCLAIAKQNRSTEGCSKLKRSVDMTSSGKNGPNIRTNASPKWDRTRCPEE